MTELGDEVMLTWLYVPGDRSDRFDKAAHSGADVVIIDWEDAVAPEAKPAARQSTVQWMANQTGAVPIEVRINSMTTPFFDEDLAALADCPGAVAVRMAKVQSDADVARVAEALPAVESITCIVESALGVQHLFDIAAAPGVNRVGLGEADLAADLAAAESETLQWCRARLVVASAAAGIAAPAMSVYTATNDSTGLARSCRQGRAMGMLGRAAVHPRQLPIIRDAFRPSASEVRTAAELLDGLQDARDNGQAVALDPHGRMIDEAVVRSARRVLRIADLAGAES